ncbi:MAG: hypothetical protein QOJ10_1345 [Chloroflexota bacterium]|jgi:hypothetical protein|nr:hypothetical protein [Chloroflexota bacterium]
MSRRRTVETSILALAAIQCLIWLGAAAFSFLFSHFTLGAPDQQVIEERTRFALAAFAWFGANLVGLIAYQLRRPFGRWLLAGIQCGTLALTFWAGLEAVRASCGQSGFQWFGLTVLAALTLSLEYLLWRGVDRVLPRSSSALVSIVALFAAGSALVGVSWHLAIDGIESHSGIVRTAQVQTDGLHVTLDTSSRDFVFNTSLFGALPSLRAGEKVVILTGESCDYGTPKAVQSESGGLWIADIYAEGVAPFTPDSWPIHELIRWLTLSVGALFVLIGAVKLSRWIG